MSLDRNTNAIPDFSDTRPKWVMRQKFNGKIPTIFWPKTTNKASKSAALILKELRGKEFLKPIESKTFRNELFEKMFYFFSCPNTLIESRSRFLASHGFNPIVKAITNFQTQFEEIGIQVSSSSQISCSQHTQTKMSFLEVALEILGYKNHPILNRKWLKQNDLSTNANHGLENKFKDKMDQHALEKKEKVAIKRNIEKDTSLDVSSKLTEFEDKDELVDTMKEKSTCVEKIKSEKSKQIVPTNNENLKKNIKKSHVSNDQTKNKNSADLSDQEDAEISISVELTCQSENENDSQWAVASHKKPHENDYPINEKQLAKITASDKVSNLVSMPMRSATRNCTYTACSPITSDIDSDVGKDGGKSPVILSKHPKFLGRHKNYHFRKDAPFEPREIEKKKLSMRKPPRQTENETAKQQFFISDVKSAKENLVEPIRDRRAMRLIKRYNSSVRILKPEIKQNGLQFFLIEITAPSKRQLNWLARDFNKLFPKWNLQCQLIHK